MSAQFIGSKISLISKSEIRYEGILYTIDPKESTIALAKVRSFGTEDRATDKPVAPRNEVYEYIIFRASDIKDLLVDDPPAATSPALADPAIIQAQSVAGSAANSFPNAPFSSGGSGLAGSASAGQPAKQNTLSSVLGRSTPTGEKSTSRRSSPGVRAKSPSESQPGDHRSGQRNDPNRPGAAYPGRPGGSNVNNFRNARQGAPRSQPNPINTNRRSNNQSDWPVRQAPGTNRNRPRPTMLDVRKLEEFDFEKANAEFEELTKDVGELNISEGKEEEAQDEQKKENVETYNKAKSFFDSISCESTERKKGNMARVDRRQERKLNQETFGVSGVYNRNWNRNGPRMPPRNRNFNQGGRGPPRNNAPGQGGRRYPPRNYSNNNNNSRSFGGDRRPQGEKATQEANSNSAGTERTTVWGPAQ